MMITYYPDGSWDTEEFTSEELASMWDDLKDKDISRETRQTILKLCSFMTETEEAEGEEYYNESCDCDCRHCDYEDDCEECDDLCDEDEDEEEDEPAEDAATIEPAFTCERCEYYCAGFSCSKSIKKKKGCEK